MKKALIVLVVCGLAGIAWAAVEVTLTIPTHHATQVIDAMIALAGTRMTIETQGSPPHSIDGFQGSWSFMITHPDPNENMKEFGERFTKELVRACVRLKKAVDEDIRYRNEIADVNRPDVNVPDDVIQ